MQSTVNSLITSMGKATKFLQRDFTELESLQNSHRGTYDFCKKSYLRTKDFLTQELQKHSQYLYFAGEKHSFNNDAKVILLINPIDSIQNFAKSLPFFAIALIYVTRSEQGLSPVVCVINFPALRSIYYAEKGGGAWLQDNSQGNSTVKRLRVSNCSNIENAVTAVDKIDGNTGTVANIRYFGSSFYNLVMFCSGKCDVLYSACNDDTLKTACSLFVRESGGIILRANQDIIASNQYLIEKIKLSID